MAVNPSFDLTVGVPVYNGARYLREALDSVLAQDFPGVRVVISDNCSDDGTEAIAKEFAASHAGITYLRQSENLGAIRNFEAVLQACETEFFAWIGDHDRWSPNYASTLVAALRSHPHAVLAYPEVSRISMLGEVIEARCSADRWSALEEDALSRFRTLIWRRKSAVMIYGVARAAALKAIKLPRTLGPDNILLAELVLRGGFCFVPDTTFYYRELREAETPEEMWMRQRAELAVKGTGTPWWHVFAEIVKVIVRSSRLSPGKKLRAIDETIWAFQMRWSQTLRSENARWAACLAFANRVLARFRGTRVPSW